MNDGNKFYRGNRFKGSGGAFMSNEEPRRFDVSDETPKLIRWLLMYSGGLIKNKKQAIYVLWVLVVAGFVFSFYLIYTMGEEPPIGDDPSILIPPNELLL